MASNASAKRPPPLPPRRASHSPSPSRYNDDPPPYAATEESHLHTHPSDNDVGWAERDPRSSSTQSLVPSESKRESSRRRALIIFVHGFMGNETSFRSFPAHVHRLLTVLLAETHVVHTKIYPRYRSRRNIRFARDNFSTWLEPHETSTTDVILCGHSMGGLLSAEVALMPPSSSTDAALPSNTKPLKHRILGLINFDVPFLGMAPNVVRSGLSSIFQSADLEDQYSPQLEASTSMDGSSISPVPSLGADRADTFWQPQAADPNYNEQFANDVVLPIRKGWRNALHFVQKHSKSLNELGKATQQLVTSHMEFGGAMANYSELKTRYARVRALEDDNENVRRAGVQTGSAPPRVRFVNYYTVSTGPVKKAAPSPKDLSPSQNESKASLSPPSVSDDRRGRTLDQEPNQNIERSRSPQISLEEYSDMGVLKRQPDIPGSGEEDWEEAAQSLTIGESAQRAERSENATLSTVASRDALSEIDTNASLPPLPELPAKPEDLNVSPSTDPATRKLLEKEHAQAITAYDKAIKDREKILRNRKKLEEKQAKKAEKQTPNLKDQPQDQTINTIQPTPSEQPRTSSQSPSPSAKQKSKREHTFCSLPPKDSKGNRDSTWIRVFMENVDEVGAHCGLFFVNERYERLVGDVADRIERWIKEDEDRRYLADHALTDLG